MLFFGLVMLGINKQLDLQSAFTGIGRIMAEQQGWYEHRGQFQVAFIAGIAMIGLTMFATALNLLRGAPNSTFCGLFGSAALAAFVIIRAASFHQIDAILGLSFSGLRFNWILEMGALLVIIGSALRRRGAL